eukprot:TRINITY_DN5016_c0_g2_i2.p1 TRINITY_DN5016_c0_g2~~TRINITY_DN5016_c0_g2_i2.p1  ORF type:complete len:467 (+),score=104.73 TRINITY_DN5016_c0_g2_i2:161-1561(+)
MDDEEEREGPTQTGIYLYQSLVNERTCDSFIRKNLIGSEKQQKEISALVDDVLVRRSTSNSCLVIGPRGCGKTAILESILYSVAERYHAQHATSSSSSSSSPSSSPQPLAFRRIYINGFVSPTDGLAFEELLSQTIRADQKLHTNFRSRKLQVDFLYDLLHPEELTQTMTDLDERVDDRDVPIVVIVDEFDHVAGNTVGQGTGQHFLYNLFDAVQSTPPVNLLVVGLTSCVEVGSMLEKRVKSRFSKMEIHLTMPTHVDSIVELCSDVLLLRDIDGGGQPLSAFVERSTALLVSAGLRTLFRAEFEMTRDPRHFLSLLCGAVSNLTVSDPFLRLAHFETTARNLAPNPFAQAISDWSTLEQSLVVAMMKLEQMELSPYTFDSVYDEFCKGHAGGSSGGIGRVVALKVVEHLVEVGAVRNVGKTSCVLKEFQMMRLAISPTTVQAAIGSLEGSIPTSLNQWARHWLE